MEFMYVLIVVATIVTAAVKIVDLQSRVAEVNRIALEWKERSETIEAEAGAWPELVAELMKRLPGAVATSEYVEWNNIRVTSDGAVQILYFFGAGAQRRMRPRSVSISKLLKVLPGIAPVNSNLPVDSYADDRLTLIMVAAQIGYSIGSDRRGGITIGHEGRSFYTINGNGVWSVDGEGVKDHVDPAAAADELRRMARYVINRAPEPRRIQIGAGRITSSVEPD